MIIIKNSSMIHQVLEKKWFLELHLSENKLKFSVVNINYNNGFFLNNPLLATLNTIFAKTLFKTNCCLMSLSFLLRRTHIPNTYMYLNLQTRHKIVQSGISRLNKNRLFVFCNVHYYLTRLSYHLRSCLNQSLLSFLFLSLLDGNSTTLVNGSVQHRSQDKASGLFLFMSKFKAIID